MEQIPDGIDEFQKKTCLNNYFLAVWIETRHWSTFCSTWLWNRSTIFLLFNLSVCWMETTIN